jgi:imidazole glycerol-phosphate synthase subunit HisF
MFQRPRIIPVLSIIDRGLVKTTKFTNPRYLGDPVNAVKIFNGKGVDELCILDIRASQENRGPDFDLLEDIASEAFMPLGYGGGITSISEIEKLFYIGYEKVILNTSFFENPDFIKEVVNFVGSQSVVVSIDVKADLFGKLGCYIKGGSQKVSGTPLELAKKAESLGVGEIIISSISRDGMMEGFDLQLIEQISSSVNIPVIALGGAKDVHDIKKVLLAGAHAAAAGSMFVYYGKQKAVLISIPDEKELLELGIFTE